MKLRNATTLSTTISIAAAAALCTSASATNPCANAWNTAFNDDGLDGETIYALAVYNGDLIAGGTFSSDGDWTANHVARWDGNSWQPLGAGTNGDVRALLVHNGNLYAGGFFTEAGGQTVNHIARWDGENWHPVGSGFNNAVMALTEWNGSVVAGGLFTHAGQAEVNRVAHLDSGEWQPLGEGINGMVVHLTSVAGELVAGGRFLLNEGSPVSSRNIARFNGLEWNRIGSAFFEIIEGPINPVWSTATLPSGFILVGGSFIYLHPEGVHPNNFPAFEFEFFTSFYSAAASFGSHWVPITTPGAVPNRMIRAMTMHEGTVIAGGDFTRIGDDFAARLARWEGNEWKSIGHGVGGPLTSAVHDMVSFNGEIIVAGHFTEAADAPATSIVGWNGTVKAGPADLNCDGAVDGADLAILLSAWGECDDPDNCPADLNGDGVVDGADLLILLANWG